MNNPIGPIRPCAPLTITHTAPGILVARSFPGRREQIAAARRWLEDTLTRTPGRIPGEVTATAVLLLSEAATNAIMHTVSGAPGGVFTVHVWASRETLSVQVQDAGGLGCRPECVVAGSEDERGRGLALVEGFADSWDVRPGGDGLWFTLLLAPSAPGGEAGS